MEEEAEVRDKGFTESRMKPEREPESEGVGGLRNRWADGGGDGWMGKGRGSFKKWLPGVNVESWTSLRFMAG